MSRPIVRERRFGDRFFVSKGWRIWVGDDWFIGPDRAWRTGRYRYFHATSPYDWLCWWLARRLPPAVRPLTLFESRAEPTRYAPAVGPELLRRGGAMTVEQIEERERQEWEAILTQGRNEADAKRTLATVGTELDHVLALVRDSEVRFLTAAKEGNDLAQAVWHLLEQHPPKEGHDDRYGHLRQAYYRFMSNGLGQLLADRRRAMTVVADATVGTPVVTLGFTQEELDAMEERAFPDPIQAWIHGLVAASLSGQVDYQHQWAEVPDGDASRGGEA